MNETGDAASISPLGSPGSNPNQDLLEGKRCPRCGSYGPFEIEVTTRVLLYDDGTNDADDGSTEFDEGSMAKCDECGYSATFLHFDEEARH